MQKNETPDIDPADLNADPNLRRLFFLRLKLLALPVEGTQSTGGSTNIINTLLYVVFHKIYEYHLQSKYMNKAQACELIPLRHTASCSKYLEMARESGYIRFERDKADTRNYLVKPTQLFLTFMEKNVDTFTASTYQTIEALKEEVERQRKRAEQIQVYLDQFAAPRGFKLMEQDVSNIKVLQPIKVQSRRKR
jgi:hypothetical protein